MGALQPGLPSPTAIPFDYHLMIIDFKDCFSLTPLHPDNCKKFAFSIPAINFKEPVRRYCWKVLSQGMCNSPTLCQNFVAQAIAPIRKEFLNAYIIHYMDDILLAHARPDILLKIFTQLETSLTAMGFCIAPEKVQKTSPFQYLGNVIEGCTIRPQNLQIRVDVYTLLMISKSY